MVELWFSFAISLISVEPKPGSSCGSTRGGRKEEVNGSLAGAQDISIDAAVAALFSFLLFFSSTKLAACDCNLLPQCGFSIVRLSVLLVFTHNLVGSTLTFDISRVFPGYISSVFEHTCQ